MLNPRVLQSEKLIKRKVNKYGPFFQNKLSWLRSGLNMEYYQFRLSPVGLIVYSCLNFLGEVERCLGKHKPILTLPKILCRKLRSSDFLDYQI